MCDYVNFLAKRIIGTDLKPNMAAKIIDGDVSLSELFEALAYLTGDTNKGIFEAWDKLGRPEYWHYLPADYDLERNPDCRRDCITNARLWAITDMVNVEILYEVLHVIEDDNWEIVACEEYNDQPGWFVDAGHLFELETNSGYLVSPNNDNKD